MPLLPSATPRSSVRTPPTRGWTVLLVALNVVAAVAVLIWWFTAVRPPEGLDYGVYRTGAGTLFRLLGLDGDLYWPAEGLHGPRGMPFTYPPFAAMALAPTALLSFADGLHLMTAVTVVAAVVVAVVIVRWWRREHPTGVLRSPAPSTIAVVWLTVGILVSGPWRDTIFFGQINAALLLLCLLDLVGVTGRARGVLIGIAAGIKLTPLAFGLYFLARRDRRGLAWLVGGFTATVALAFVAFPSASVQFWTTTIRETGRIGGFEYADNVAVRGALEQLGVSTSVAGIVWVPLVVALVVAAWAVIRGSERMDAPWLGIAAAALVMLLVSPISWSHHWVWWPLIAAAGVLLHRRITTPSPMTTAPMTTAARTSFSLRWGRVHATALTVFTVFFLISPKLLAWWTGSNVDVSTSRLSAVLASLGAVAGVVLLGCWAVAATRTVTTTDDAPPALSSAC